VKSLTFFPDQLLRGKLRRTSVTYLDNSKNSQPIINPASCLAKTHLRCVLAYLDQLDLLRKSSH
jgi:hypothetical protein